MMTDMFSFDIWLRVRKRTLEEGKELWAILGESHNANELLQNTNEILKAWEQSIEYQASLDALGDNIKDGDYYE